jgi:TPR repeat protein
MQLGLYLSPGAGFGITADEKEALRHFYKACVAGMPEAAFNMWLLLSKHIANSNAPLYIDAYPEAKWFLKLAADLGDSRAYLVLAAHYENGSAGFPNAKETALYYYHKAGAEGKAKTMQLQLMQNAQSLLGSVAVASTPEELANEGYASKQFEYGQYLQQQGKLGDAARYLELAANQGHQGAQQALNQQEADCHFWRVGAASAVTFAQEQVINLRKLESDSDARDARVRSKAMYHLGLHYEHIDGNTQQAIRHYQNAAASGHPKAERALTALNALLPPQISVQRFGLLPRNLSSAFNLHLSPSAGSGGALSVSPAVQKPWMTNLELFWMVGVSPSVSADGFNAVAHDAFFRRSPAASSGSRMSGTPPHSRTASKVPTPPALSTCPSRSGSTINATPTKSFFGRLASRAPSGPSSGLRSIPESPARPEGSPAPNYNVNIHELEARARGGDCEAQYRFAQKLQMGEGVKQSSEEAALWRSRAAAQGHLAAQRNLVFSEHLEYKDFSITLPRLHDLALQGDVESQYKMWVLLGGLEKKYQDKNFNPRSSQAKYLPVDCFLHQDFYLKLAADGGHPEAEFEIGSLYAKGGKHVTQDFSAAKCYYERAAGRGEPKISPKAQAVLKQPYMQLAAPQQPVNQANPFFASGSLASIETLKEQERLSTTEFGNAVGADPKTLGRRNYLLGFRYHYGIGCVQDFAQAKKFYLAAKRAGYPDAARELAKIP